MKKLLKGLWFHIKFLVVRGFRFFVTNIITFFVALPFIYFLFSLLDIIFLGFDCYDCLLKITDEIILTEEEISNKRFYFSFLGIYFLAFLASSLLLYFQIRLVNKMKGKAYYDYEEDDEEKKFF